MKRRFTSLVVWRSTRLVAPRFRAMAAVQPHQPTVDLTPGPAAGVQTAQSFTMGTLGSCGHWRCGGVVAIVVIVAASGGGNGNGNSSNTGDRRSVSD